MNKFTGYSKNDSSDYSRLMEDSDYSNLEEITGCDYKMGQQGLPSCSRVQGRFSVCSPFSDACYLSPERFEEDDYELGRHR